MNNVTLKSGVEGATTIISIIEEGTMVKPGDVLCVLDSSILQDQYEQQQIKVTQAEANVEKANQNVHIQETQNTSDLAAAKLQAELASMSLKSFVEFDRTKRINEARGAVFLAEDQLSQGQEEFEFYKEQTKRGYANQQTLETSRIKVAQYENALKVAKDNLKLLQNYTLEQELQRMTVEAENFGRDVERVERTGLATLAGFKADKTAAELILTNEKATLARLTRQIEACKLVAPQPGEVVYAAERSRRSEPTVIEEGASVHENQAIIKLPDLSKMKVDARIHESKIRQIRVGQPVRIYVDARPNHAYEGRLHSVSSVPASGSWPNTDLKEYEAVVAINDPNNEQSLKPGMTSRLEVIVAQRSDVMQAPVQAIVSIGGNEYITYVLTPNGPEKRDIVVGQSNDDSFEILEGLKPGEKVILNPRTNFADDIAELQAKYSESVSNLKPEGGEEAAGQTPATAGEGAPGAIPPAPAGNVPPPSPGDGEGGRRKGEGGGGGGRDPAARFKQMDKNGDGKIGKDEASERMAPMFDAMDKNGDGGISLDEFQQAMQQFRQNGGGGGGGGPPGGGRSGE